MKEVSFFQSFAQVRQQLLDQCKEDRFASAQLLLVGAGITPVSHPGLWEYLARRSQCAGNEMVAKAARRILWDANVRSADLALKEAKSHLEDGDFKSCNFVLEEVFGQPPKHPAARHLQALCLVREMQVQGAARIDRDLAVKMAEGLDIQTPSEAITIVDLLRFSGALDRALVENARAQANFPDDARFTRRAARILEQTGDFDGALGLWQHVAAQSDRYRTEARFKLMHLYIRLEHRQKAEQVAATLCLSPLSLPERIELALALGQQAVVVELVKYALSCHKAGPAMSFEDGCRIAELLLDNGDIGLALWMRRQKLPTSAKSKAVLDACGFGSAGKLPLPGSFGEAVKLRSPDFLSPLEVFLQQDPKPAGWPGTDHKLDKILLVNASLAAGGAERQFVSLVHALLRAGLAATSIEVAFYSLAPERGHAHFLPDMERLGVKIHDLERRSIANLTLPKAATRLIDSLPAGVQKDTRALWYLVNELKPQVLHGWQDRAALAAGTVGVLQSTERVVLSARNMSPHTRQDAPLLRLRSLYQEFANRENYTLTANSRVGADDYANWLGCAPGQVQVLANCIDTDIFSPCILKPCQKRDKSAPLRIGGVFRLANNKRPVLWLQTVAAINKGLPQKVLPYLFGRGPLDGVVRDQAKKLGFKGFQITQGRGEAVDIYSEIDVLLLMSRVEGTPNVILEAQACGLPVAACDVGGVREALYRDGPGGGLLLPADIVPSLAARRMKGWMAKVLAAPAEPRIEFVKENYGTMQFSERAIGFYTGALGQAK